MKPSQRFLKKKYTFLYGDSRSMSVTVKGYDYNGAYQSASDELERRYEKAGMEPPVGWTLDLVKLEMWEPNDAPTSRSG